MAIYTLKGKNLRIERDAFRQMSTAFGVRADAIGQRITLKGREFRVNGINPNFSTRPFVVTRDDGVHFPVTVKTVRKALAAEFLTQRDRALRTEIGVHGVPGF